MNEARSELPPLARSNSQTINVVDVRELAPPNASALHGLVIPKLAHLMRSGTTVNASCAGINAMPASTRQGKRACGASSQRPRKRWSLPKAAKNGAMLVPDVSSSTLSSRRSSVDIFAPGDEVSAVPLTRATLLRHNTATLGLTPLGPDHMQRRAKLVQKSTFELIAQASAVEF
ncbi:hypothetical protein SDRG_12553 [Saprolegnia diclina VS20]|uniref:Uncharacterized protein n=1 Tax=Saprolegnia diclina (strain VS20) TaxID=1156394 RepID=T0RIT0_SAPDV|nr:hypothetical protein SDRG_12553 [Saprolegnia diclina VS20]EQC29782.1 hypothetical protein SDRG_12553 [Saprolegnia diclina VS20]|eukprot:XP_008616848.1 hypothetical protein SDRG_12553 [Saprolegnia diclina VS20]